MKDNNFYFGYVECEISMRHQSGDIQQIIENERIGVQERERKAEDVDLGIIYTKLMVEFMSYDDITGRKFSG